MGSGRRGAAAVLLVAIVGLVARSARAHDEAWSTSDVVIDDSGVHWNVDVGLAGLGKLIDLGAPVVNGEVQGFDEAALVRHGAGICAALGGGLAVSMGETAGVPNCGTPVPKYETGAGGQKHLVRVVQPLQFAAPGPFAAVKARVSFFSQLTQSHRAVIKIRWAGELLQTTRLGPSELVLEKGRLSPGRVASLLAFVQWGVHHILIGYDHIAFLLALLLVVHNLRALITIVTAFTVAHSLTILLAALEVVTLPAALTEMAIAGSIVYVAIENLVRARRRRASQAQKAWPGRPTRRWPLVFAFGLVHGLGFAEVLRERLAEASGGVVASVIAFNVGVELGQLVVVAIAFPALRWLRGRYGERRVVVAGSAPILVLGAYWLLTRMAGGG